jgi:hypothetical protein
MFKIRLTMAQVLVPYFISQCAANLRSSSGSGAKLSSGYARKAARWCVT